MYKQFLFIWLFNLACISAFSQQYSHANYDWEASPQLIPLTEAEQKESAIIIKDKRVLEFAFEGDDFYLYKTIHRIVRVNDDVAVESNNKVFVPTDADAEFITLKARAMTPGGKVVTLNKENIKEVENMENYGAFKIFAIEGVEKGGEVEYFYTTKSSVGEPYGGEYLQSDTRIREIDFSLISPQSLEFETKCYNGFPQLTLTIADSLRTLQGSMKDVPALLEEQYSNYRADLMRVNYKISKNKDRLSAGKLYDWNMAANMFAHLIHNDQASSVKMVQKELKKLKLNKIKSPEAKARAIEEYIKTNFAIEAGNDESYRNISDILVNKYASELGITRLFAAFLNAASIPYELVVTCERANAAFDKDFEAWNLFTDLLLYLPEFDKYIGPTQRHFRMGAAPYAYANNYGLFISKNGSNKVKEIQMSPAKDNVNRIDAHISFDAQMQPVIRIEHGWTGFRAAEFRAIYEFQRDVFAQDRAKSDIPDAEATNMAVKNEKITMSADPNLEFIISADLKTPALIEKAGNNYLFKLGEVIGSQVEMYQKNERQHPIDMPHPIYYKRTIKIEVPQGYHASGLEDIKIDKSVELKGKLVNRFISDYKIEGNTITVSADEYYEETQLPKEKFEAFRSVINAAADFNKVTLIFERM